MPDTEPTIIHKLEDMNFVRADKFTKIYANNAQVESSIWDVRLTFGDMTVSEGKANVEQLVTIVMSPQLAKALANVLTNNIAKYEQEIGAILLPVQDDGSSRKQAQIKPPPSQKR
jgi:hypothetical protein